MTSKKQNVNELIAQLKAMIDEARQEGLENIGNLYAEELQTTIAMAKLDGKIEA